LVLFGTAVTVGAEQSKSGLKASNSRDEAKAKCQTPSGGRGFESLSQRKAGDLHRWICTLIGTDVAS